MCEKKCFTVCTSGNIKRIVLAKDPACRPAMTGFRPWITSWSEKPGDTELVAASVTESEEV